MEKIKIQNKEIVFRTISPTCLKRAKTILTKQPWTIEWINSFDSNDIFLDVGANIGIYSIYASKIKETKTFSIEPESRNYNELVHNIIANSLEKKIFPLCFSLYKKNTYNKLLTFDSKHMDTGSSSFINERPESAKFNERLVLSFTLDYLVENKIIPIPTHIKIDTDGSDFDVLSGMKKTLKDKRLKTITIELPERESHFTTIFLKEHDFVPDDRFICDVVYKGQRDYFFRRKQ